MIYIFLTVFSVALIKTNDKTTLVEKDVLTKKNSFNLFFSFLSFLSLFFISSFRDGIGIDYTNYIINFEIIRDFGFKTRFEYGFWALNRLISYFTYNYIWVFIFTSLIVIILLYTAISQYSNDAKFTLLLYFCLGFYIMGFTLIRQAIGMGIIMISLKFIYERKLFQYLLLIILASLFHISAIIFLPAYFICTKKISLKLTAFYLFFSFIISSTLVFFTKFFFGYSTYYFDLLNVESSNFPINKIFINVILMIFCMIKKDYIQEQFKYGRILINLQIMATSLTIAMSNIAVADRFTLYYTVFQIFLIPCIFSSYVKNKYLGIVFKVILFSVLLLLYIRTLNTSLYEPLPYRSLLF